MSMQKDGETKVASTRGTSGLINDPLQKDTEADVSAYAESKGCLHIHLNIIGRRGWPDHLYIYHGRVMFIEYKRPGEKPGKLQDYIHRRIMSHGIRVTLVYDFVQGCNCIDFFVGKT